MYFFTILQSPGNPVGNMPVKQLQNPKNMYLPRIMNNTICLLQLR